MKKKQTKKKLPKLDTLVEDIYKTIGVLSEDKAINIPEEEYEKFGKDMSDALRGWATPQPRPKNGLRMSNIGRPLRRLWYDLLLLSFCMDIYLRFYFYSLFVFQVMLYQENKKKYQ